MASEPLFEERSDAVKVSETPYPTNGSGKNPGRGCSYQMCFPVLAAGFFANTHYSAVPFYSLAYFHRSRMTAGVLLVFYDILTCVRRFAPYRLARSRHFPLDSWKAYLKKNLYFTYNNICLIATRK